MTQKLTKQNKVMFFSLYITQYLGFAFFTGAFIGILRQNGISLENLGFIYMLGLFWVLRFLWAPFIDTINLGKKLGHYRGWIIIFQSFMVITLLIESMFNILDSLSIIIILAVLFAFFSASQDIALDALVLRAVSLKDRPLANALKNSGGLVGMVLGSGAGLIVYTHLGWQYTMMLLAGITIFALLQILLYKESKVEKNRDKIKIDFRQYLSFWRGKRRLEWLFLLIIYPIAISSAFALIMPMLVDQKWQLDKIGFYLNIVGYGIGVLASFAASWIINKLGKRKVLIIAAAGQVFSILLLLLIEQGYTSKYLVMLIVIFIFCFSTPSAVVMTILMMDESSEETPAAQFAIQHSIYMFSGIFFGGLAVSMSGLFGYQSVIICGTIIGMISLFVSMKINLLK